MIILCRRYGLGSKAIIGHYQVAKMFNVPAGASACPGRFMIAEMPGIIKRVARALGEI
jgi:hypothetical protein